MVPNLAVRLGIAMTALACKKPDDHHHQVKGPRCQIHRNHRPRQLTRQVDHQKLLVKFHHRAKAQGKLSHSGNLILVKLWSAISLRRKKPFQIYHSLSYSYSYSHSYSLISIYGGSCYSQTTPVIPVLPIHYMNSNYATL